MTRGIGTVYAEGHAVAFMALLKRLGGEVVFTRAELDHADGVIQRFVEPDGSISYRLDPKDDHDGWTSWGEQQRKYNAERLARLNRSRKTGSPTP